MGTKKRGQAWNLPPLLLVLLLTQAAGDSVEIYQPNCREALGMHSGLIKDEAISASSSYDVPSVGPHNSRIRTEKAGGAWCPKTQIAHNVYEYLEVDLGQIKVITLVETQGRFGNGQGQEYAQQYMLEYQRNATGTWIRYYNKFGKELFKGNSNTYIAELRQVNPPIIARRVRFVPYSRHPRTVCMRVELYGCDWTDGLMSYNMRQGEMRGTELDLRDYRYDGTDYSGWLAGGLGQLTDLEEGITNFRMDQDNTGNKGYEWVGWKNDSVHSGPVQIVFNFDAVRNFSFVRIHCNNMFTKGVRVFDRAKLYFSAGGDYYQAEPEVFEYMRDSLIEYARRVIIPIPHRVARKIKLELYYAARWILISEVKFESEVVPSPVTPELPPQDRFFTVPTSTPTPAETSTLESPLTSTTPDSAPLNIIPQHRPKKPEDYREQKHQKILPVETPLEEGNAVPRGAIIHPEPHDDSSLQEEHIGIIIGTLAALILLLFAVAIFIIIRNKQKRKQGSSYGTYEKQNMNNRTLDDVSKMAEVNGMLASYHMYNAISTDSAEDDTIQRLKMKQARLSASSDKVMSTSMDSRDITTFKPATTPGSQKDLPSTPLYVKLPPESHTFPRPVSCNGGRTPPSYPPPPIPPPPHLSDLLKVVDFTPVREDKARSLKLVEFPRENLVFVEKLGDGEFGEVHQCEAYLGCDKQQSKSLPVAVKVLQRTPQPHTRESFLREAEILAGLKDPNIAMMIGVSTQAEPLFMIIEYSKHGDLHQFLLQRRNPEEVSLHDESVLSYGCQIHLAIQIASGMKYLTSLNMVHRDIAARNCLVTHNYTVKIGDLGASRILYENDYHRLDGRTRVPLRWMAWEAAILGKFSSKSDVWSFAVTLWEILTLARERPFSSMTDQQIITNCSRIFNDDTNQVYLSQPLSCPREVYDLMCECWNRDEALRPTFREIHMFLQRKNMGYNPNDDIYMKPWA